MVSLEKVNSHFMVKIDGLLHKALRISRENELGSKVRLSGELG